MTSFALVLDNNIIQINPTIFPVAPPMVWTTDISATSPEPQVGWAASESGGVWSFTAPPAPPALTIAQQAEAMLGQGIAITSTGTPALNATYPIATGTQALASQIVDYITANASTTFPGEPPSATLAWDDITGTAHTFPSVTEFKAFYDVAGNLVAALNEVIAGNSTTLPAATATIP